MDADERGVYTRYVFRYGYIPLDGSYHMSIQPPFPNLLTDGKVVRPDMYFWIPNKPRINIVVECDGFVHHSTKEAFNTDRQRDRAFKMLGFDVFRFSGSEIYNDPVNAPYELVQYLRSRAKERVPRAKKRPIGKPRIDFAAHQARRPPIRPWRRL
jgi:very-short-patch-repair endonuclease